MASVLRYCRSMRSAGIVLVIVSLGLGAFCYWGMSTETGRRRFDEMAGMIPMAAGALAGLLLIVGAVLVFIARR